MAVLIRSSDQVHFVLQTYRERIARTKRPLLEQRIRLLAEQHGQYAHLSLAAPNELEIAFSTEAGYLLGETIWEYFGKPAQFIFCERLPGENNQVLLIVVRNSSLYLDTQLSNENLMSELLPLLTRQQAFRVVTSGMVALQETMVRRPIISEYEQFALPPELVTSFETLSEPLLPRLPILESCRLLPLPIALRSKLLGWRSEWFVLSGIVVVLAGLIWLFYPEEPAPPPPSVQVVSTPVDHFSTYYKSLMTPAPSAQLQQLVLMIKDLYLLPGWSLQNLTCTDVNCVMLLSRDGGNIKWFTDWANQHHYPLTLTTQGVQLTRDYHLPNRPKPAHIYAAERVASLLVDQLQRLMGDPLLTLGAPEVEGKALAISLTINLTNASPGLLLFLGQILRDDWPVELKSVQINSLNAGLINGVIQLVIWRS